MKKLMIAASVALVGAGAFAACADGPGTPDVPAPAAVYQWQFKGKTSTAVVVKNTETTGGGCVDSVTTTAAEVIRIPGSLALVGYTYICNDECQLFGQQLQNPTKAQFYGTKPWKSVIVPYRRNFITTINVAHVVGKKPTQYELEGVATFPFTDASDPAETFELTFAGFGSYDKKNGRVTSVSGNFAGTQTPPRYTGVVKVDGRALSCPPADYWNCQTLDFAGDAMAPSVAYGSWSVKYNKSLSKKLEKNQAFWAK